MKKTLSQNELEEIKFDKDGLVPVVVQDSKTGEVLMTAWANKEALELTAERGELVLWSRSRRQLWHKGLSSGNRMKVMAIRADCDKDTLLAIVEPFGPACHTGERSCFFRTLHERDEPCEMGTFPERLYRYLKERATVPPEESYTARLVAKGPARVAQKVGEEGVETALALAIGDRENFRYEAADLLYHLLVACIAAKVPFDEVIRELQSRHKPK